VTARVGGYSGLYRFNPGTGKIKNYQLKIKFLTNLSHELRTPVSLVTGPIDKLIGQERNNEKKSQLSLVRRNVNRILNLVNQLLDFKKLEENELNLNLADGDLVPAVQCI